jgi:hypothetical protein
LETYQCLARLSGWALTINYFILINGAYPINREYTLGQGHSGPGPTLSITATLDLAVVNNFRF